MKAGCCREWRPWAWFRESFCSVNFCYSILFNKLSSSVDVFLTLIDFIDLRCFFKVELDCIDSFCALPKFSLYGKIYCLRVIFLCADLGLYALYPSRTGLFSIDFYPLATDFWIFTLEISKFVQLLTKLVECLLFEKNTLPLLNDYGGYTTIVPVLNCAANPRFLLYPLIGR